MFQERRIISDETARFEELLVRQRDFFVEEELKEKYKRLVSFVQQTEAAMSSGKTGGFVCIAWVRTYRMNIVARTETKTLGRKLPASGSDNFPSTDYVRPPAVDIV